MSAVDIEAECAILRERDLVIQKYANHPALRFDSCYCVIVYQHRPDIAFGSEKSDDKIVAVYSCPLHVDSDPEKCCKKARDDCRKANYKFGVLNRDFTDEEKVLIAREKAELKEKCLRVKNKEILEKLR